MDLRLVNAAQIFFMAGSLAIAASVPAAATPDQPDADKAETRFGLLLGGVIGSADSVSESASTSLNGVPATFTNAYDADKSVGYLLGLTASRSLADQLLGEAELSYRSTSFSAAGSLTGSTAGISDSLAAEGEGTVKSLSLMLNGWYTLGQIANGRVVPFIGGGAGLAVKGSSGDIFSSGTLLGIPIENRTGLGNDAKVAFAWQVGAGVRFHLSSASEMSISYRYFDGGKVAGQFSTASHMLVAGFSF